MKLNAQLVKLNRSFLICFVFSATVSAVAAQLLSGYESHINTTITIAVGYVSFFTIFSTLFYFENKNRFSQMGSTSVKSELLKLISSLGIGEIVYLAIRWSLQFYLLENSVEPYLASLTSEIIATSFYLGVVSVFLKATKTY